MSTLKEKAEQILNEKETKIIPENLPNSVTAFGVTGNISEFTSGQGTTYPSTYRHGSSGDDNVYLDINFDTDNLFRNNSSIAAYITDSNLAQEIGLTPEKIKKDETILGVTGTYEGTNVPENQIVDIDSLSAIFVTTRKDILGIRNLGSADGFGTIYSNTSPYIYYDKSNKIWKLSIGIYFSEILSTRKLLYITFADLEGQYFGYSRTYIEPTTKSYQRVAFDQGNMLNKNGQVMSDEEILQLGYLSSAYDTEPTSN